MQAASRGDMYRESNLSHLVWPPGIDCRETISFFSARSVVIFAVVSSIRRQPPDTRAASHKALPADAALL